ncbi:NrdH-redoxin, partial [bacterium (Candidatus Moisslbacteria) CG02_land_8_20_14_3_00_36_53]
LKNYLKEKGFEFEEVDVSHDQKEREELMEKTGQATLPIIEINQQFIAGFDKKKIDGILGIKG